MAKRKIYKEVLYSDRPDRTDFTWGNCREWFRRRYDLARGGNKFYILYNERLPYRRRTKNLLDLANTGANLGRNLTLSVARNEERRAVYRDNYIVIIEDNEANKGIPPIKNTIIIDEESLWV